MPKVTHLVFVGLNQDSNPDAPVLDHTLHSCASGTNFLHVQGRPRVRCMFTASARGLAHSSIQLIISELLLCARFWEAGPTKAVLAGFTVNIKQIIMQAVH